MYFIASSGVITMDMNKSILFFPVSFYPHIFYLPEEAPQYSSYTFGFSNPILFFDPNGAFPYTFHVRAFAPPGAFTGTGFHDDRRGFSTNVDASSRIRQAFTVDPTAKTYSGGNATSDATYWNDINVGTASNEGAITSIEFDKNSAGNPTAYLSSSFEGSNPAFQGAAPDIEVSSAVSITENLKAGQLHVSLDLSSKQFPATEALIQDSKGNSIFLAGAAAFGGAGNLFTADKKPVSSINLIIGINDKGIFQNVTLGGKTYSIEDFNKLNTSKPAGPFPPDNN